MNISYEHLVFKAGPASFPLSSLKKTIKIRNERKSEPLDSSCNFSPSRLCVKNVVLNF